MQPWLLSLVVAVHTSPGTAKCYNCKFISCHCETANMSVTTPKFIIFVVWSISIILSTLLWIAAYLGLFDHRVTDANCYKPPHMTNISSLDTILDEQSREMPSYAIRTTTISDTERNTTNADTTNADTTVPSTTMQESAATETTTHIATTTASPATTESTTATEAVTTKKPKNKKKPKKKPKNKKKKNKAKNKATTVAPSSAVIVTTVPSQDISGAPPMPIAATAIKIGGRYCKREY